ncbi:EAP30/Vps36 family-domain-containing protein [Halteromyces radiatus]|uniref:EAP30/Vps36 family-domain-containing protein n=1 Tax=Halteromyces radiatus TaxID=101107 RepID=UPI002220F309|nr:EAP30/Vps36 family-domain-containing protein [Halteromyces radiatus]KAI8098619.1 EAP30/Vps36 family-domain-containing protein [Halteromyces radiatus]
MRRRQAGVGHTQQKDRLGRDFQQIGDSIAAKELEQLQRQLETFKQNLEEFAWKHQKDIKKDPMFRSHFQRMCANIGVDPLASNKGFWADMLGVGDFYYELGIQIIEACMQTRSRDGGLTALQDLTKRLDRMRSKEGRKHQEIIEDDIIRAIKTLKPLNGGFQVITLGAKKMVRSVPNELDKDQAGLLLLAQRLGYVDYRMIQKELAWDDPRIEHGLDQLIQDGLVWVDDQGDTKQYWVPSYFDMMD